MLEKKSKKIKPSYDEERQELGKILPLGTPFKLIIDSSEACNFKCRYCFRSDSDRNNWGYASDCKIMQWEIFKLVVEQIKEFPEDVKQISLSCHGEPLCNPMLPDMVKYIKENGIQSKVSIHTNAALLDEHCIEQIVESGINKIVVSLQGLSAKKYKEVCGAEIDYSSFFSNLAQLYKKKKETEIFIKVADVALDYGEEEKFYQLFGEIADRVYVEKVVPIWKNIDVDNIRLMKENKYGTIMEKQNCCPVIFHTLVVTPNGDVYPCTQLLGNKMLGNVKSGRLYEFWNGSEREALLREQLLMHNIEMCNGCNIRQNSIFTPEDMIDKYREEILLRLTQK